MDNETPISLPQGYDYFWYDEIDSTNLEAFRIRASGQSTDSWVCAKQQTGGRGTKGNRWVSKRGNLHASLLTRSSCPPSKLPQISILAALACIEAIEQVASENLPVDALCLKWPNDILLHGSKICGILVETRSVGNSGQYDIVVGAGINLASNPPIDGLFPAGNLAQNGWSCSWQQLFAALVGSMRDWFTIWQDGEGFETLRLAWLQRSCHIGSSLQLKVGDREHEGRFTTISSDGAMVLEDKHGHEQNFSSGHIVRFDGPRIR